MLSQIDLLSLGMELQKRKIKLDDIGIYPDLNKTFKNYYKNVIMM